jgi:predicted HAD superfamily Cof-like phosphohydrolase
MSQLNFDKCVKDAGLFLQKFGTIANPLDDKEMAKLRIDRQKEELKELSDSKLLDEAADAIIDICYIAAGTVHLLGDRAIESERLGVNVYLIKSQLNGLFNRVTHMGRELPLQELWNEVHTANMKKERGTAENSKHGSAFDIIKPAGWKAPDIAAILRKHKIDPQQDPRKFLK